MLHLNTAGIGIHVYEIYNVIHNIFQQRERNGSNHVRIFQKLFIKPL